MNEPTQEQIAQLMALPPEAPLAALNLFRFRERACYQAGDPEFGSSQAEVAGVEAYQRYGRIAGPMIEELGGRVVFSTAVDQIMIGPAEPDWDLAAIMYFPTRRAFMEMLADTSFQRASRHRKAALADHMMLHLAGDPFV